MFNMMDMFGKVKEFQARMKEAQASLNTITESGESGAGMVRVTVNGLKQIVRLNIDQDLIRPDDREMLQDLVVAATNKALENVEPKIKAHLQKATEGLLPNIPGFDLGNLMS
ncbi:MULTISPECIES: YbaB/EbfC family nucleoid-associated protein [Larkinella]|jgi:DNA-binding YbaB/EbfC family protein|uniref:Nucleoid-associated protein F0P93_13555 n=2 Tax=Larkinella TaxID=332157 RepID=A0A5N1JH43_9BACT|nr:MULTISPECIES: YbaB/EbfC family nucleoid-associated protein [Larkinella]KAA9353658.1 YbaB/EbfC family nucleoid-associated protein [Larkinella humicola]RCR65627.1 YbaB/EbfC family nucleoid-associated protein [Larkinella punicea]